MTEEHSGIIVVRDDLFPGGTKARFIPYLFQDADEVVYASPAEGGAQVALASVARKMGKRATIFVAQRKKPHFRTLQSKALGARIMQVKCGYLSVVNAKARTYCQATGATQAPFGMEMQEAIDVIAAAAKSINYKPSQVWCAAGSGVLAMALETAWPEAEIHAVQVGRKVDIHPFRKCPTRYVYPKHFSYAMKAAAPFPSDPHYDRKAWDVCLKYAKKGALFWNVLGDSVVDPVSGIVL